MSKDLRFHEEPTITVKQAETNLKFSLFFGIFIGIFFQMFFIGPGFALTVVSQNYTLNRIVFILVILFVWIYSAYRSHKKDPDKVRMTCEKIKPEKLTREKANDL